MKIMVFLHGTAIMHRSALGQSREARVRQVLDGEESIYDFASYVPVGNAVGKLQTWKDQGAEIAYLSPHQEAEGVEKDKLVLARHGFPAGQVFYRRQGNSYQDVAEKALPDVLIEDDCESIGGEKEMTYPHLRPEIKSRVKSIVVKEFGGLDHLPDELPALLNFPG
jgi:hypothetical protein